MQSYSLGDMLPPPLPDLTPRRAPDKPPLSMACDGWFARPASPVGRLGEDHKDADHKEGDHRQGEAHHSHSHGLHSYSHDEHKQSEVHHSHNHGLHSHNHGEHKQGEAHHSHNHGLHSHNHGEHKQSEAYLRLTPVSHGSHSMGSHSHMPHFNSGKSSSSMAEPLKSGSGDKLVAGNVPDAPDVFSGFQTLAQAGPPSSRFHDVGASDDLRSLSDAQLGSLLTDAWQLPPAPPTVPLVHEARVAQYKEAAEASRDALHRSEVDTDRLRQQLSAAEIERDEANQRMRLLQQRTGSEGDMRDILKSEFRAGFSQMNQLLSEATRFICHELKSLLNTEVQNIFGHMSALELARVTETIKRNHLEPQLLGAISELKEVAARLDNGHNQELDRINTSLGTVFGGLKDLQHSKVEVDFAVVLGAIQEARTKVDHAPVLEAIGEHRTEVESLLNQIHTKADQHTIALRESRDCDLSTFSILGSAQQMNSGFNDLQGIVQQMHGKIGELHQQSKREPDFSDIHKAIQDHSTDMNSMLARLNHTSSTRDTLIEEALQSHKVELSLKVAQLIEQNQTASRLPGVHETLEPFHREIRNSLSRLHEEAPQRNTEPPRSVDLRPIHAAIATQKGEMDDFCTQILKAVQQSRGDSDGTLVHRATLDNFKALQANLDDNFSKIHSTVQDANLGFLAAEVVSMKRALQEQAIEMQSYFAQEKDYMQAHMTRMWTAVEELGGSTRSGASGDLDSVHTAIKEFRMTSIDHAIAEARAQSNVLSAFGELRSDVMHAIEKSAHMHPSLVDKVMHSPQQTTSMAPKHTSVVVDLQALDTDSERGSNSRSSQAVVDLVASGGSQKPGTAGTHAHRRASIPARTEQATKGVVLRCLPDEEPEVFSSVEAFPKSDKGRLAPDGLVIVADHPVFMADAGDTTVLVNTQWLVPIEPSMHFVRLGMFEVVEDLPKGPLTLYVTILHGRNLKRPMLSFRRPTLWVHCSVPGKPNAGSFETKRIKGLDPEWQEKHQIDGFEVGDSLDFRVGDKDSEMATGTLSSQHIFPRAGPQGFDDDLSLSLAGAYLRVEVSLANNLSSDAAYPPGPGSSSSSSSSSNSGDEYETALPRGSMVPESEHTVVDLLALPGGSASGGSSAVQQTNLHRR